LIQEPPVSQGSAYFSVDGIRPSLARLPAVLGAGLAAALLWIYGPTLADMAGRWGSEAQYSHGFLVPLFSAYLLWSRRGLLAEPGVARPSWWGLPVLALALALRFAGVYLYFDWLSAIALLPCLAGLTLLAGGGRALRWAWPAIVFLAFMVPLPFRVEKALAAPLQRVATLVCTFALQTLGFVAFSEGNVIRLGEVRIGVVEACSGLSMLISFFALSAAVTLVSTRSPLERGLIFVSAVPIAVLANILRIIATAVLHKTAGRELADLVFHDLAGWLMMPLGLALLWAEVRLLSWVLLPGRSRESELSSFALYGFAKPHAGAKPAVWV
jgi:exosortase